MVRTMGLKDLIVRAVTRRFRSETAGDIAQDEVEPRRVRLDVAQHALDHLATLPEIVERSKVKAPTLIIVGNVVQLRDKLKWFEPADG